MKDKKTTIITIIIIVLLVVLNRSCAHRNDNDEKYTCGGCGTVMTGAYWDYDVDYGYLCRTCSKILK